MGRAGKHRARKEASGSVTAALPKNFKQIADDEDIDDDLAFDSEDEKMYGQFFKKQEEAKAAQAKSNKKSATTKGKGKLDAFDDLHYGGDDDDDDDDDGEGFDLSDLLDDDSSKKKKKKPAVTISSTKAPKAPKAKHGSARAAVTREGETLFVDPDEENRVTAPVPLKKLVTEAASSATKKEAKLAKRLQSATSKDKQQVFATDVDPEIKERADRANTREIVKEASKKWQPTLREMRKAKHLQFPLKGTEESAIPNSLGAIASNADPANNSALRRKLKRGRDDAEETEASGKAKTGAAHAPKSMAEEMAALLVSSGLSSKVANPAANSKEAKATTELFTSKDSNYVDLQRNRDEEGEGDEAPIELGYVQKLKAMLSYEVAKRRRFNKIKSKTYRRILRKEKEREEEKRQRALEILNPEAAQRRVQAKMEKMRAMERATQKHKNTSKWVRHAKKFSKFDDETRDAIHDQHQAHQRLMQKMDEDAANELQEAAEVSEDELEERRVDDLLSKDKHTLKQAGLKSVLWGNDEDVPEDADDDPSDPTSKARRELRKMGFMQKAKERQEAQLEQEWSSLQEDVERVKSGQKPKNFKPGDLDADDELDADVRAQLSKDDAKALRSSLKGHSVLTRGAAAKDQKLAKEAAVAAAAAAQAELETRNATTGRKTFTASTGPGATSKSVRADLAAASNAKGFHSQKFGEEEDEELEEMEDDVSSGAEEEEETSGSDEDDAPRAVSAKAAKKAKNAAKGPSSNVLGGDSVIPAGKSLKQTAKSATSKRVRIAEFGGETGEAEDPTAVGNGTGFDDDDGEEENQQDYLVSRAFAADEIDEDFLKTKESQVETIMKPQDPNASLPGWGEWGGEDERLNKRHREKVEKSELARRIEKSSLMKARVDAKLQNVIVNHDVDLVPTAYSLKMVPRPFANAQEYQRSMRQPAGPEWNTATTFRDGVLPRVTTKRGTIIDPLSKASGKAIKARTSMRKKRSREEEALDEHMKPKARKAQRAKGEASE